jgi:hypothetical protein
VREDLMMSAANQVPLTPARRAFRGTPEDLDRKIQKNVLRDRDRDRARTRDQSPPSAGLAGDE